MLQNVRVAYDTAHKYLQHNALAFAKISSHIYPKTNFVGHSWKHVDVDDAYCWLISSTFSCVDRFLCESIHPNSADRSVWWPPLWIFFYPISKRISWLNDFDRWEALQQQFVVILVEIRWRVYFGLQVLNWRLKAAHCVELLAAREIELKRLKYLKKSCEKII